jgi:hypothetical protein
VRHPSGRADHLDGLDVLIRWKREDPMSDQATKDRVTISADTRAAYEPSWYASLLAFAQDSEAVDDREAAE